MCESVSSSLQLWQFGDSPTLVFPVGGLFFLRPNYFFEVALDGDWNPFVGNYEMARRGDKD